MINKVRKTKGITLIALAVTIVVLLILAGVSLNLVIGNSGIITKAKESKFKTYVAKYKEAASMSNLEKEIKSYNNYNDIFSLKGILKNQKESLAKGALNCDDKISLIQTAEGAMMEIHAILQRINELLFSVRNENIVQEDIDAIKTEVDLLIMEIDNIANETKFDNRKVLIGYSETVKLENGNFDQGNIDIKLDNMSWSSLYGSGEMDYNNLENEIENIEKAITKVANARSRAGSFQNRLEWTKKFLNEQENNLLTLISNIFGETEELSVDVAIANAESWNTTISFIQMAKTTYSSINSMLLRINELWNLAENETSTDEDRISIQYEISELIKEIDRQLTYTGVTNKKFFDGSFPYIMNTSINSLDIENIDATDTANLSSAKAKIENAIQQITDKESELTAKSSELASIASNKADMGYAFEINSAYNSDSDTDIEISEEYKNKLKFIDGKLTYIGNDEEEKEWSRDMGIDVLND